MHTHTQTVAFNVVLVFAVQQSELDTCLHISRPAWCSLPPSHPSRSPQSSELSFLSYTAGSHQLSVLHSALHKR